MAAKKKAAKKKGTRKKAAKKKVAKPKGLLQHRIKINGGRPKPYNCGKKGGTFDLWRGYWVDFKNNNAYPVTIKFPHSPFVTGLKTSSFTIPAKGLVSKRVSNSAKAKQHHYEYSIKQKPPRNKKVRRTGDGPPGPPDVIVAG